jgi:hypothetical protein
MCYGTVQAEHKELNTMRMTTETEAMDLTVLKVKQVSTIFSSVHLPIST